MHRQCSHCHRHFTPFDVAGDESDGLETERAERGLHGVRFLCYECPACGLAEVFVDVYPLMHETIMDFRRRRDELERAVRDLHADGIEVIVTAL